MLIIKGYQLNLFSISVALLSLPLVAACGAPEAMNLGKDANGSQVEIARGQTLIITLEGNPSTGYGWEVAEIADTVLRQLGEIEYEPTSDLPGAPAVATIRFEPVGTGQSPLEMVYRRPWEEGVAPIDSFSVQVTVQ